MRKSAKTVRSCIDWVSIKSALLGLMCLFWADAFASGANAEPILKPSDSVFSQEEMYPLSRMHVELGRAWEATDKIRAAQQYELALILSPEDTEVRLLRGNLYLKAGRMDLAINDFKEVIASKLNGPEVLYNKCKAAVRLKALGTNEKCDKQFPGPASAASEVKIISGALLQRIIDWAKETGIKDTFPVATAKVIGAEGAFNTSTVGFVDNNTGLVHTVSVSRDGREPWAVFIRQIKDINFAWRVSIRSGGVETSVLKIGKSRDIFKGEQFGKQLRNTQEFLLAVCGLACIP